MVSTLESVKRDELMVFMRECVGDGERVEMARAVILRAFGDRDSMSFGELENRLAAEEFDGSLNGIIGGVLFCFSGTLAG